MIFRQLFDHESHTYTYLLAERRGGNVKLHVPRRGPKARLLETVRGNDSVYDVDMTVTYSGDGRIDTIRGKQVFYVTKGTLEGDTSGKEYWQLRAWEDQGINS